MSAPLKDYRVFGFDDVRHLVTSDWLAASSDEEAISLATGLGFTKSELWEGDRLVAQLEEEHRAA